MAETKEPAGGGLGTSAFVGVLACLAAAAYISYQRQDYVAAAAACVVAAGATLGFWKGAVGFAALAAGAAGGYALAPTADALFGSLLDAPLGSAGAGSPAIRLAACGLITAGVIQFFTLIIGRNFVRSNPSLASLNSLLGLGLGGTQAAAATVLFLCGILAITPQRSSVIPGIADSAPTNRAELIAHQTRKSAIFPYLLQYDPFQHYPELRQALNTAQPSQPMAAAQPMPQAVHARVPGAARREPFRSW